MRTTVVCGLLGSGKTSFIKNFVRGAPGRIVVLVNDFGAVGIDGEIFSAEGIRSMELPSGCVCCTLKFDLISTIQTTVRDFAPDHLIIEPSGIASPSAVTEALEVAGFNPAMVIGIVDASEFTELYDSRMYGRFFEDQIASSDIILVNKTDLADEATIEKAVNRIESINPRAILYRTVNSQLPDLHPIPSNGMKTEATVIGKRKSGAVRNHIRLETLSFRLNREVPVARVSNLFDELAQGRHGNVARAKALIATEEGPYRFDCVFGRVDKVRFEQDIRGDSRLVVIGTGLDREAIGSFFDRHRNT